MTKLQREHKNLSRFKRIIVKWKGGWGEIQLSKSTRSLTGVERPCYESEQVLCELEDLPFAPFPAAHLCSWEGEGGRAWKGQHKRRTLASQLKKEKKKRKENPSKTFLTGQVSFSLLHTSGCVSVALVSARGGSDDHE